MKAFFARFSEPSSYAGLATVAGMLGLSVPPGVMQSASLILAGACGIVAFFMPEKKA